MKTALLLAGLISVGAIGYYLFVMPLAPTPGTENTPSLGIPAPGNEGNYPEPQNKLNIDVICTEALAYMSFPSSAEADAWVAACVRGEHPEAVEQWKQMNGITDDRTI